MDSLVRAELQQCQRMTRNCSGFSRFPTKVKTRFKKTSGSGDYGWLNTGLMPSGAVGTSWAWSRLFALTTPSEVRFGSRLCENSDVELARRISVSISSLWKPITPATPSARRQLRKQFCAPLAQASFHTAWVKSGFSERPPDAAFLPEANIQSCCRPGLTNCSASHSARFRAR